MINMYHVFKKISLFLLELNYVLMSININIVLVLMFLEQNYRETMSSISRSVIWRTKVMILSSHNPPVNVWIKVNYICPCMLIDRTLLYNTVWLNICHNYHEYLTNLIIWTTGCKGPVSIPTSALFHL